MVCVASNEVMLLSAGVSPPPPPPPCLGTSYMFFDLCGYSKALILFCLCFTVSSEQSKFPQTLNGTPASSTLGGGMDPFHACIILQQLKLMYDEGQLTDIVVEVDHGKTFSCHRNVLAAISPYFRFVCTLLLICNIIGFQTGALQCPSLKSPVSGPLRGGGGEKQPCDWEDSTAAGRKWSVLLPTPCSTGVLGSQQTPLRDLCAF